MGPPWRAARNGAQAPKQAAPGLKPTNLPGGPVLDLDADLYLAAYDQAVLLEWIDVLWSCFLEARRACLTGVVSCLT